MADLSNQYKQIFKELEENIEDEKQRNFVINKFQELSVIFMDIIDRLTYVTDARVKEVEEKQKAIENKILSVQKTVDGIENDIYEEEEAYEFEITCPYCNHEFITDINSETNSEVECPECHNIIELDWNVEDDDEDGCHHCSRECLKNQALTYDSEENEEQEDQENNDEDDDEDM